MSMQIFRITVPVTDIHKATAFYGYLLEQEGERVHVNRHYFYLEDTILALYDTCYGDDTKVSTWKYDEAQNIYISTDNIEELHERLKGSDCLYLDDDVKVTSWGEKLFYMVDPFANQICFVDQATVFTG